MKETLGVLASALAITLMAPATRAEDKISVPYEHFELPNGLDVIVHEDHTTPVASVNVWNHVGSGRDKPARTRPGTTSCCGS